VYPSSTPAGTVMMRMVPGTGNLQLLNHSSHLVLLKFTVSKSSVLNRDGFEPEILEHNSLSIIKLSQIEIQYSSPGSMDKTLLHTSLFPGFVFQSVCFSSMSPSNIFLRVIKLFISENQQIMQHSTQK
jgi:hypothetical protein